MEGADEIPRDEIAAQILRVAEDSFGGNRLTGHLQAGSATKYIKQVFGDLGKSLGFTVAAAGYARADDGEWLYDMSWFVSDPKSGLFLRQPFALESELKPGGTGGHGAIGESLAVNSPGWRWRPFGRADGSNNMALIAIPVVPFGCGAPRVVMAVPGLDPGIDPAIHENAVISVFNKLKIKDYLYW